jgi:two-component system C4-dicarboxylate transport sensor histidine kinase DctB
VGLGLAIASGIVADFSGRLTARNGRDGGAVFELYLPHAERAVATAAE